MDYYLTKEAKADGYTVKSIKTTHLGEDYGTVAVEWANGEIFEIEAPLTLAVAIKLQAEAKQ